MKVPTDLLLKYDRPGPRYTSYPTAPEFTESFGPNDFLARIDQADREAPDEPLSLYFHLPFCEKLCLFCGCNVVISKNHDVAGTYLANVDRELDLLTAHLPHRRSVCQLHFGGGTPTYLSAAELDRLHEMIARRFRIVPGAEIAIEMDPRVTTEEHVKLLARLGFNRASMGVQDFDERVQKAVHRIQPEPVTQRLLDWCRENGFHSVNIDLMYGLPNQTPESYRVTLEAVLRMRPDRVAVFNYAHVPWLKPQQGALAKAPLPSGRQKLDLLSLAIESFTQSGYRQIGMDHFALEADELAQARECGKLHRNFQGYTVMPEVDTIAFGVSSISDLRGAYAQNQRKLPDYEAAIAAGRPATMRGFVLSDDDRLRRHVIMELLCNFQLDKRDVESRYGVPFDEYFKRDLDELREPIADGLATVTADRIEVTPTGRLLIRNVCMAFDPYLRNKKDDRLLFSRTI